MNRKGSNALGIAGIVVCILLFDILVGYFTAELTKESMVNVFQDNCDCGITGCAVYYGLHGFAGLYNQCSEQASTNVVLKDSLAQNFFQLRIVSIILLVLNLALIIVAVLIIRGVSG